MQCVVHFCRPHRGASTSPCISRHTALECCLQAGEASCEKGDPAAEIVLLSFSRPDGALLSATPFGGKLEMMLRLAGLAYKGCIGNVLDGKHAPKKKVGF